MLSCGNQRHHRLRKIRGALPIFSWKGKTTRTLIIMIMAGLIGTFGPSQLAVSVNALSTYNVVIVSYLFRPQNINIATGTSVLWTFLTNGTDSVDVHTVTADNRTQSGAGVFQSTLMHPGQTFTYTFYSPGKYPYRCSVHPTTMTGLVNVSGPALNPPSSGSSYLLLYVGLGAIAAAVVIGGAALYFRKSRRAGKILLSTM